MNQSTGIESRAMKFRLQRGALRRTTRDRDAEAVVKQARGDEGQVVSKKLFQNKNSPVHKYNDKSNELYQYHIAATLPCGDDGTRLLKNSAYFDYTSKMTKFIGEMEAIKQEIVGSEDVYYKLVDADIAERNNHLAQQGKPTTASRDDYLSFHEMEDRLYITWYAEPISTSGDFRFEIPDEMRKAYDDNLTRVVQEAKQDVWQRVITPMVAFVAKMSVPIGAEGSIFRDTMVTNLTDLIEQLPHLNIDDDPNITALTNELTAVMNKFMSPDVLRNSQGARDAAKRDMEAILNKVSGGWKI